MTNTKVSETSGAPSQPKIDCPHCGKEDTWHLENTFRPFCSARCKLIDLGEWASESRKIPGDTIQFKTSSDENSDHDDLG